MTWRVANGYVIVLGGSNFQPTEYGQISASRLQPSTPHHSHP
ncbi:hypothetical protein CCACVL1_10937 [Corchorus capsularis]|uniref:Uncharacterized protein n=1 Tax=Corchorus capsularis TaxID=210143 RepID=A0A1R3INR4_COCAP|nr:hypothetical protein CCACVL1_10937 [Corchorus capsularis]